MAGHGATITVAIIASAILPHLDASTYQRHFLHQDDRVWPETNCYVDLWIELLHSLQLDPIAPLAFLLSADFDGEQWEFFKYPPEDLRELYGLEIREFDVWRPLADHIQNRLRLGHLLTVEADAWFLPDTAGVSYRLIHQKTTISPTMIDPAAKRLGYFHNRGYYEVSGEDYEGVLRNTAAVGHLSPYAEMVSIDRLRWPAELKLHSDVEALVARHLRRRPSTNPVGRLATRIVDDTTWLQGHDADTFHRYAFGTLRQCGAWADTTSTFVRWLDHTDLARSAEAFGELAATTKTCQFMLARLALGRGADLGGLFNRMSSLWEQGYGPLLAHYGP